MRSPTDPIPPGALEEGGVGGRGERGDGLTLFSAYSTRSTAYPISHSQANVSRDFLLDPTFLGIVGYSLIREIQSYGPLVGPSLLDGLTV